MLLTALVLCLPAAPLRAQAAVPVARFTAGGVTVIHKPITANDVIAVRVYLKGGSAALTPATAGIEKLIGELSVHGTSTYPKETFAALTTQTGTNIGAEVDRDYTVFTLQAVRQKWEQAWDLFQQAVLHPAYPEEEVDNVRRQILDRLAQRRDTPDEHLEVVGDSLLYAGHPYAVDPLGTEDAIEGITRDQLIQWHLRRFTKANLLIVAVGNVGREDLTARITAAFGMLPATGGEAPPLPPIPPGPPGLVTVKQDLPTNYILGLYAGPAPASPDYPALRIATRVLGERLFEEVRTRRNLTYAVTAGLENQAANHGDLYVTAVDPDTTFKVILAEVRRLQEEPV
jgi:zinc protease